MSCAIGSLTYLTADLPGIGGTIKVRPEDFLVEEQPQYEPSGEGEHLFLYIEKRRQTTTDVIRRVAKMFSVQRGKIGYAGLKDKHAVTRQHLSVHLPDPSNDEKYLSRFEFTPFKLLWSRRHHNKLRRGHLKSNRFVIYIRDVDASAAVRVRPVLDLLINRGAPNYFGHQRFGYRQTNHELGRLLLTRRWQALLDLMLGGARETDNPATRAGREAYDQGDYTAAIEAWSKYLRHDRQALDALCKGKNAHDAVMAVEQHQRDFLISAVQSAMFNDVLDQRVEAGLLSRLVEGDLASLHANRAVFAVDADQARADNAPGGRVDRMEVSPSGPMWGPQMIMPAAAPLACELRVLERYGLSQALLDQADHISIIGNRRPMRMTIANPDLAGGADEHGPYVRLAFDLDKGSFATTILREIMKNDDTSKPPRSRIHNP